MGAHAGEETRPTRGRLRSASIVAAVAVLVLAALLVLGILGDAYELGDVPRNALAWIRHNGPGGAILALYAEESGIPVLLPGDVFVIYLGRHVNGPLAWFTAWLALIAAVVLGATNLYWVSRKWGRALLEGRVGSVVHLTPARLDRAERWFARHGVWALIFGRHIPGFRIPITVAAGTLQVRYRVFAASVAVSSAIWAGVFLSVGMRFGRQFERFLLTHHLNYAIAVPTMVVAIAVLWGVRHLGGSRRPGPEAESEASGAPTKRSPG
ncbi:MAG: DedA family protein [Candidatus Dormibacteria bacterium]